jgi:hypothetical protein
LRGVQSRLGERVCGNKWEMKKAEVWSLSLGFASRLLILQVAGLCTVLNGAAPAVAIAAAPVQIVPA